MKPRAPYAVDPAASRGRVFPEVPDPERTPFQRDRDRIVHSTAFRRLKDKTQVFLYDENDHFRTRLTHTLEVAQVARSIARALSLDEDLAEAVALAHDFGHPPFGHAGERALDAATADFGGFDHNAQSLRVVTFLERTYPRFDGLNLSWETLEGLAKHNGPITDRSGRPAGRYEGRDLPAPIVTLSGMTDLRLWSHASAEAQAAAIADDIAYDAHDIDDGLRAGLLTLDGLREVPMLARISEEIDREYPELPAPRFHREIIRRVITVLIFDVLAESRRRLAEARPGSADELREAGRPMIAFSEAMSGEERAVKDHLKRHVYRHSEVMSVMHRAEAVIRHLFDRYRNDPTAMPAEWTADLGPAEETRRIRRIADFLAGMTDRYAIAEYERFFHSSPELRWKR